jgi:hypothetical protein
MKDHNRVLSIDMNKKYEQKQALTLSSFEQNAENVDYTCFTREKPCNLLKI